MLDRLGGLVGQFEKVGMGVLGVPPVNHAQDARATFKLTPLTVLGDKLTNLPTVTNIVTNDYFRIPGVLGFHVT